MRTAMSRDGDVAFTADRLVHVGGRYEGPADRTIDGSRRFVMPGLINVHSHPTPSPRARGCARTTGCPRCTTPGSTSAPAHSPWTSRAARPRWRWPTRSCCSPASPPWWTSRVRWKDGSIARAAAGCAPTSAPFFADAFWKLEQPARARQFDWDEARGRRYFEEAIRIMDRAEQHPSGRLHGIVYPGQIETCTEAMLRDAAAHAHETRAPTHHPHLAVEARVPGDRAPPREDPARVRRGASASSAPDTILGHAHLHRRAPGHPVAHGSGDLDRIADSGSVGGALPLPLRPLWPGDGPLRPLPGARGQHGDGNRRRPPTTSWRRCASRSSSPG